MRDAPRAQWAAGALQLSLSVDELFERCWSASCRRFLHIPRGVAPSAGRRHGATLEGHCARACPFSCDGGDFVIEARLKLFSPQLCRRRGTRRVARAARGLAVGLGRCCSHGVMACGAARAQPMLHDAICTHMHSVHILTCNIGVALAALRAVCVFVCVRCAGVCVVCLSTHGCVRERRIRGRAGLYNCVRCCYLDPA